MIIISVVLIQMKIDVKSIRNMRSNGRYVWGTLKNVNNVVSLHFKITFVTNEGQQSEGNNTGRQ